MLLDLFGFFYSQNSLFWRIIRCTFLFFFLEISSLFSISISSALCFLYWYYLVVSIKGYFPCKYNPSIRLNVCCIKSKNIRLRFIASSFRTSMSYLSLLRAIIYCSNNTSPIAILMHGLPISNGFFFLDEGHIHFSYSTSANHFGSLTCSKYKNLLIAFNGSN